jgi:hypothetical protein
MKEYLVNAWVWAFRFDTGKVSDYCFTVMATDETKAQTKGLEKIQSYYGYRGKLEVIEAYPAYSLL